MPSDAQVHVRSSVWVLLIVAALSVEMTAKAQTDNLAVARRLFSCPIPRFDAQPKTSLQVAPVAVALDEFEVQHTSRADDAERYHWMNGRDLLSVPLRSEQGGAYGWIERKMFEPNVVRFKNVSMTGSLVTAVKRRNPFYLLQPAPFFSMDW
jgi:hypothetical protein